MLIDADNISHRKIKDILDETANYGTPTIKRIYGDFTDPKFAAWKSILLENSITPIQQYAYTTGKNATDSALIIDAMDILHKESVNGFCIVSSDSDYTRLASRIRESGREVLGFGEKKTPKPFIKSCDKFIYVEILGQPAAPTPALAPAPGTAPAATQAPAAKAAQKKTSAKRRQTSDTQAFGRVNDADIGDIVNFRSTVVTQPGAENYVFHDKMSAGLTLNYSSAADISVTLNGNAVADGAYTVRTGREVTDGCTFEIVFSQAFCNTLGENGELVIGYSATVNENAVIAGEGNPNESRLTYGEDGQFGTTPSITKTYTWGMDVLKYANGNREKTLEGVKFVLLNSGKSKAAQVANGKLTGWVDVPAQRAPWPAGTELITDAKGEIIIDGLDADTYYLRETAGLPGYNKLADDQEITITATPGEDEDTMTFSRPTAYINNQSGTELPSTGGVGTAYFYALGGVLAVGAAVLLVTRKRVERA